MKKNGTVVQSGTARSTYVRHDSGHSESSGHIHILVPSLAANDYVEIFAKAFDNSANTVQIGTTSLYLEKVASSRRFFQLLLPEMLREPTLIQEPHLLCNGLRR